MAHRQESRIVSFDADGTTDRLLEVFDDDLRSVAEYTPEDYTLLYVSESTETEYGSRGSVEDVADSVHEYLHLDFRERELFDDLFPPLDSVEGFVTVSEGVAIARLLTADDEGLYFSTTADGPVVATISEVARDLQPE